MNKTQIEWVRNPDGSPGYTWNPITGCLNGCEYCYARRLANTSALRERYLANTNLAGGFPMARGVLTDRVSPEDDPFYPRFWPERLDDSYAGKAAMGKAKGIFTCDMSDLFGIGIPEDWTGQVLNRCRMSAPHRFYLLTKQPQNLRKFSPFSDNCYVGVTVTNTEMFVEACYRLKPIIAKVKYLSLEPLLDFEPRHDVLSWQPWIVQWLRLAGINWLIIGAQTKPYKPPKIEWVREIIESADKAGIPVFLKPNLKPLWGIPPLEDDVILRQEMPK